jgi:hypothetical protein
MNLQKLSPGLSNIMMQNCAESEMIEVLIITSSGASAGSCCRYTMSIGDIRRESDKDEVVMIQRMTEIQDLHKVKAS